MKKKKKREAPFFERVLKLREDSAAALRIHESALNSLKLTIAELKKKYGFAGICWESKNNEFSVAILRGHVGLLKKTLELYEFPAGAVFSLRIKFVPHGSFMAVNGDVMLGMDEVPEQWIATLQLVANSLAVANFLPKMVREISELLRGIQIRVDFSASAFSYRRQLQEILQRLRPIQAKLRQDLPILSHLWAKVGESTSSLNLAEDGTFQIPSTVRPTELIEFLLQNSKTAVKMAEKFAKKETNLNNKIRQCVDELKLAMLSYESGLPHEELMECLQNLLAASRDSTQNSIQNSLGPMLKEQKLHIGRSYGILPDGRIVIPIDWAPL